MAHPNALRFLTRIVRDHSAMHSHEGNLQWRDPFGIVRVDNYSDIV